jgi:hypothetical protein
MSADWGRPEAAGRRSARREQPLTDVGRYGLLQPRHGPKSEIGPSSNALANRKRAPWNKGKLTGAKPPARPKHVWSIRTKLQIEGRVRDLAMFNLAIDSKLRGCDVVAIKVDMSLRADTLQIAQLYARRRLVDQSDLN